MNKDDEKFFSSVSMYVVPTGIGKCRIKLFKNQFVHYGGEIIETFDLQRITHILVDESVDWNKLCRIVKQDDIKDCRVVKSRWMSSCLRSKKLVDVSEFIVDPVEIGDRTESSDVSLKPEFCQTERMKIETEVNDPVVNVDSSEALTNEEPARKHWICAHASSSSFKINHNQHITEKLKILAETYKNTKDEWRALGYQKAIASLSSHPKEVTTWQEAKSIRGIGERLADKIYEIIQSGHLRKIDEVCSGERVHAVNLFTKVWGAGPSTAELWVQQGYRTIEDLKNKAKLTKQQKVGLMYYDDLSERMSREEAGKIEEKVREIALNIQPGLEVIACGSYRRGKPTCGDVDVLLTHPDGESHAGLFKKLLEALHKVGFLTDDLVIQEDNGKQQKYLGVCLSPVDQQKHRRLDIIVVPYEEFACALMYFTGSAHFNRSMRHLAQKLNMSLSEHSLNKGVVRDGKSKLSDGYPLPTPTEESVFEHLGLPYRSPAERDH